MRSLGARAAGLRLERMRASPGWAGDGFRNRAPIPRGLRDTSVPGPTMTDFLCGGVDRVPDAPLPSLDPRAAWTSTPSSGLRATWLGHSTVLVEIDGHRVLTDPVWGPRASPSRLVGPKRFQPVPVRLADVPARRRRRDLARPLRPPRLPDDPRAREIARAVRDVARRRRASRALGRRAGAHRRARLVGDASRAGYRPRDHGCPVAALLGARTEGPQRDAVVVDRRSPGRGIACSSAATRD